MKVLLVLSFMLFSVTSFSQVDFVKAVELELNSLEAQKKALNERELKSKLEHSQRQKNLENEFIRLQNELLGFEKKNQIKQKELSRIKEVEANVHDQEKKSRAAWVRLFNLVKEKESFYHLNLSVVEDSLDGVEVYSDKQKLEIVQRLSQLFKDATQSKEIITSYLKDTELVEGEVVRFGLMGAQAKESNTSILPGESGRPEILISGGKLSEKGFYIFENYRKVVATAEANVLEKFAFMLPAIFIAVLFLLVFGIFALFVRE